MPKRNYWRTFLLLTVSVATAASGCNRSNVGTAKVGTPVAGAQRDTATGKMRCPDGSEAIRKTGKCGGVWHVTTLGGARFCEFAFTQPMSCKGEGFIDDGIGNCYGPPYRAEAQKGMNESECGAKYGTPPNNLKYDLYCCKS